MHYKDADLVVVKLYLAIYTKCRINVSNFFFFFFLYNSHLSLNHGKEMFPQKALLYVTGSGLIGARVAMHGIINTVASG